ncbi:MAG: hypothetical protein RLZZ543_1763 [Bacteroidota bacterium]|jgi:photosystem II stability/assembly factor-like uncharacterized protein
MRYAFLFAFLLFAGLASAQQFGPKINADDPSIPAWAQLMYSEQPNVLEVERLYKAYYREHPFRQNNYTRYYKRWRRYVTPYMNDDGSINYQTAQERLALAEASRNVQAERSTNWNFLGPIVHRRGKYAVTDANVQMSYHANVYCIDQSMSNPNVLYCGTECGGVYKTIDKGQNWEYVTENNIIEDVSAISVDPTNENVVLFSAANEFWRSTDGGATWTIAGNTTFQALNISAYQFNFHPTNPQIVFAATTLGLYKSSDNGINWTQVFTGESMSVEFKPGNPQIVYALRYNTGTKIAEFYKSIDGGTTFSVRPNGWFTVPTADVGLIESRGGRIAVTQANNERVYVLLVGESQATAALQLRGTIGIYSSADAGENWSFPHAVQGMPYDVASHPNLMDFDGYSSDYDQIYYNTALACSQLDENKLLIGGLNLWRSNDGGTTYETVGGYIGNLPNMHVDLQEFKVFKTSATSEEFWFSSDGGINYSTDWCTTHESRTRGVYGSNFWGMDQGWNEDIIVGGRYHNGNAAYAPTFDAGLFLRLGGGESATGYVNYSPERKTYFSDIGGRKIPVFQDQVIGTFSTTQFPNESYYDNSSSRMLFDWNYWNVVYMGKDNVLYKSSDGGSSFGPLYTFGTDVNAKLYWIEQSHANTNVFYVQQVVSNVTHLWKTVDGGVTFSEITLPQNKRELYFTLSHTNANELWIAYTGGANGNKVYTSNNAGQTWTNITSTALNGLSIKSIANQAGTNGGVYIATRNNAVYYRSNTTASWQVVGTGLPAAMYPLRLMPFYRMNKLRLGTWHLGIWEIDLVEPSAVIPDFSADFRTFTCPGDTVWLVNHSVCDSSATLLWSFPGASPSSSTALAPKITYAVSGTYPVTLTVTQNGQSFSITKDMFISAQQAGSIPLAEDFELGTLPAEWKYQDAGNDGDNWVVSDLASSYATGSYSMFFDNYYMDVAGKRDRFLTGKLNFSTATGVKLAFDVAYSQYSNTYSDSLAVMISTDCGQTYSEVYLKGGDALATAPDVTANRWVPAAAEWRRDSVLLFEAAGAEEVIIAFENRGHYGQPIYVDKINLSTLGTVALPKLESNQLSLYPNPASNQLSIRLISTHKTHMPAEIYDVSGKLIARFLLPADGQTIDVSRFQAGMYLLRVRLPEGIVQQRFVKE